MAGQTLAMARGKRFGPALSAALLCRCAVVPAKALVFHFENMPVPANSLRRHCCLQVYSETNGPSQQKGFSPTVEFRQVAAKKSGTANPPPNYNSVEVSLLPYDQFWNLVRKEGYCAIDPKRYIQTGDTQRKLTLVKPAGKTLAQVGAFVQTAPFVTQGTTSEKTFTTVSHELPKPGKYVLVFTNCGNFSEAIVTGSVAVRNAHGFLPAHEFATMRLFGRLTVLYAVLFTVWLGSVLRHRKYHVDVHTGVCMIILCCFLECLLTWVQYRDWNETGDRRLSLAMSSEMFHCLKHSLSWSFFWPDPRTKSGVCFFVVTTSFLLQNCIWKSIISSRTSHLLGTKSLMMVIIAGVVTHMAVSFWAFLTLRSLSVRIARQKHDGLAQFWTRIRNVLALCAGLEVCIMMLQMMDLSNFILLPWEYQWLSADGAHQFAFTAVLMTT